jgi:hypothetical protein
MIGGFVVELGPDFVQDGLPFVNLSAPLPQSDLAHF